MNPIVYIVLAVNLIGFIQMGIDKRLAVKGKQRIPEAQLIAPAFLGGIIGIVAGMLAFRHKTAKRSFQLKLASVVLVFAGMACYLFIRARS
ncbi:DUF1294 domain-containing protein [Pontiella sulfatireligans]|uniref:DUF1294 domain-containing protein n=1 Tax=Pontiella sulfatireligans TaxID=2750658 RepID=A0A6C2UGD5_9BACT|nr:DUF1294 domain-containing protein [Pontiella sulfatireligans]VGO19272.1 hypothetical protein SCARR_01330 [Pontiella sulfatireligans]